MTHSEEPSSPSNRTEASKETVDTANDEDEERMLQKARAVDYLKSLKKEIRSLEKERKSLKREVRTLGKDNTFLRNELTRKETLFRLAIKMMHTEPSSCSDVSEDQMKSEMDKWHFRGGLGATATVGLASRDDRNDNAIFEEYEDQKVLDFGHAEDSKTLLEDLRIDYAALQSVCDSQERVIERLGEENKKLQAQVATDADATPSIYMLIGTMNNAALQQVSATRQKAIEELKNENEELQEQVLSATILRAIPEKEADIKNPVLIKDELMPQEEALLGERPDDRRGNIEDLEDNDNVHHVLEEGGAQKVDEKPETRQHRAEYRHQIPEDGHGSNQTQEESTNSTEETSISEGSDEDNYSSTIWQTLTDQLDANQATNDHLTTKYAELQHSLTICRLNEQKRQELDNNGQPDDAPERIRKALVAAGLDLRKVTEEQRERSRQRNHKLRASIKKFAARAKGPKQQKAENTVAWQRLVSQLNEYEDENERLAAKCFGLERVLLMLKKDELVPASVHQLSPTDSRKRGPGILAPTGQKTPKGNNSMPPLGRAESFTRQAFRNQCNFGKRMANAFVVNCKIASRK